MEFRRVSRTLSGIALAIVLAFPAAAQTLHMGGTGAATAPLRQIGARFTEESGIVVEIIPGLGTSGGINAATEGVLQLVASARAPTAAEATHDLITVLTTCTPYVLASSHPSPGSIDSAAVAALYAQDSPAWADGTPLRIVLRPKVETDNVVMAGLFPGMDQGLVQARKRDVVPIAATDQDNADMAEQIPGSLIGTTYAQIISERRGLRFVPINGVLPGLDAYETGRYPFGKRLYIIGVRQPKPEASRFLDFLRSDEGGKAMRETGLVPCPK